MTNRKKPSPGRSLFLSLLLALNGGGAEAFAASPSQFTPDRVNMKQSRVLPTPELIDPRSAVGALRSDLAVTLGDIELEGQFDDPAVDSRALLGNLKGRRVTVTEIFNAAKALEQLYAKAGYALILVTVPPQSLKDGGKLRLQLVDGTINEIVVDSLPSEVRSVVLERLEPLRGKSHLRLAEIERHVMLAGDVPGLKLKSALAAGKAPGTTRLILDGTYERASAIAMMTNDLSQESGGWRRTLWVSSNSIAERGEQIYASVSSAWPDRYPFANDSLFSSVGLGAVLPLDANGLVLTPEYSRTESNFKAQPLRPSEHQAFERFSLRGSIDITRTRREAVNLSTTVEHVAQGGVAGQKEIPLSQDNYWVARVSVSGQESLAQMLLDYSLTQSFGLGGRDQGDSASSHIPLSRDGSDPHFLKLSGDLHLSGMLDAEDRFDLYGAFQYSWGQPLMQSERFALDGQHALAGFEPGAFSVDSGLATRMEISRPADFSWNGSGLHLDPYLFGAAGWGIQERPTVLEAATIFAQSAGFGVRSGRTAAETSESTQGKLEFGVGHVSADDGVSFHIAGSVEARF